LQVLKEIPVERIVVKEVMVEVPVEKVMLEEGERYRKREGVTK
jgi:hypothetical protein